jgi:HEAT repeat protein
MNALEDENANLRMDSAWALGLIGDARAVDALRKRLADIERPNDLGNLRVCDHAAAALRDIKTDEARALTAQWQADPIPFFVEGLTSERTKNRHRLAFFLGSFQDERIVSALITALDDDDAEVQRGSAWSLGHMGDKRAIPHLLEKLGSADALPRSAMIQALGRLKADEAVTHLVKQLDDESPYYLNQRICDAAAEALLRIGTPEAIASVDAWNQTRP